MRTFLSYICSLMLILTPGLPLAQQAGDDRVIEEVISIGTRVPTGRTATALPVPVDRIGRELIESVGNAETGRILQSLAPSFNFPSSTISDGTDALRPATLRGLGPDQVLVLVNGKRRHTSALVHINGSVGRGSAGVDLNAIAPSAIGSIEVLRDGAAAQYGSDAIAGVINIVLNRRDSGGEAGIYYGQYTEDSDGETVNGWVNYGMELGSGGFLNLDINYRDRGRTNRAGLDGSQFFPTPEGEPFDPREFTVNRDVFRVGDADNEHLALTLNGELPVDDRLTLYGYLTWSDRDNISGGFYRRPSDTARNPAVRTNGDAFEPEGFLPLIETAIEDIGLNLGARTQFGDWAADFSLTWSENEFAFGVSNSVNASWVNSRADEATALASPRSADAGTLTSSLLALNADFSQQYDWGNLALGAEWREENYEIQAGEDYSWQDYDNSCFNPPASGCLTTTNAAGGIQVFPGFRPSNEVDENRDIIALYLDAEYTQIDNLVLTGALRYEDYSDFGSTLNFKLAGRWQFSEQLALRGALSTGFRAPSMQQQFFSSVSTQFVSESGENVAREVGTFRNNGPIARAIDLPTLKEEESTNYSLGLIYEPSDTVRLTLDLYRIDIDDRILVSGSLGISDCKPLRPFRSERRPEL